MKGVLMLEYDSLEEFRDPQTYDLVCGGIDEEVPLVEEWARALGGPVLDLACGTGRTALPLAARGYAVTGVDLVPEMLALARQKADALGVTVEWVESDARAFHLGRLFGCIYLVGNAFQFFHTRADQEALLARVREHLLPEGGLLFETRNPSPQNLYELHHPEGRRFTGPDGCQLTVTAEQHYDPFSQIQHYTSYYSWLYPDGQRVEQTKRVALRYTFPQELDALLHYNGLRVHARYGSWQREPLAAASREMILVCQRRN